ncbi:hypothetical protein ACRALDRAFT_2042002 [Sodiomyces alcalophilus JCM 7366]|uniref:uncharacterized protein n=1 Tax=Sodiomyces alcalophilus JCM 7366 TaxID=591952 RepID=UPI0039B3D9FA
MSLISYHPREGRDVVLRHRNAIVVRDPDSQRLEIRGITECPTCHQPIRPSSPDRHGFESPSSSSRHDTYVDPNYFRMLRAGLVSGSSTVHDEPPSSPILRMIRPVLPQPHPQPARVDDEEVEFVQDHASSQPSAHQGGRIRREAFSPNYFNTFFVEERELGRGGKGVVLLVRHEIDGCHLGHFACKRVPVGDNHAWLEKVLAEVELLAKLSHPNLVSYRHVWLEDVQLSRFGPRVACAFILQQYCNGGDLLNYVVGDRPKETTKEDLKEQMRRRSRGQAEQPRVGSLSLRYLSFEEIYSLFRDVTSGLAYLHAANYIHRDLKPSNCLLHREGTKTTCLISDFGEVEEENAVRKSTGATGTISYCAPEVLKMDASGRYGNFTTKSDIFSLGVILYFLCFSRLPYQSANVVHEELEDVDELRAEITDWKGFKDERRERPDLPSKLYQLLKRLLALDPAHRPSASEVLAAMKSESYPEGVPLAARSSSPSIGLQGRVQNLDSPGFPGTPVPDPQKQQRYGRSGHSDRAIPSIEPHDADANEVVGPPVIQNGLQRVNRNGSPSRRSTQATVASANANHFLEPPPSPERTPAAAPPLLMAPPTTWAGHVRHKVWLGWYQLAQLVGLGDVSFSVSVPFLLRLGIFSGKMLTLLRPCWPYVVNPWLGAVLVSIAGVDLASAPTMVRSWERGSRSSSVLGVRQVRTSVLLALVHFVILWMASRWGTLCALPNITAGSGLYS